MGLSGLWRFGMGLSGLRPFWTSTIQTIICTVTITITIANVSIFWNYQHFPKNISVKMVVGS